MARAGLGRRSPDRPEVEALAAIPACLGERGRLFVRLFVPSGCPFLVRF